MPDAAPRRLPRHWRLIGLGLTAALCLAVLGGGTLLQQRQAAHAAEVLHRQLQAEQVTLSETDLQARALPVVARPDLSIEFTDLPNADRAQAEALLGAALAFYPPGFVHKLIDHVILAGNIRFWGGEEVGGFYFDRGFAINCRVMDPAFVTRDIHHELSSLVREHATPPDATWTAANPPGFTYLTVDAARAMMREGRSDEDGPAIYDAGFVRSYGTTSIDNDYNTYAERMFTDGPAFAALIRKHPRMQAKTRLVMASYLAVDPAMGHYFETSGLAAAAK